MRRHHYLLILAVLPLSLSAQAPRDSIISVSSSRTTKVPPDRASFYIIVEGTAETPPDAIARVDTKQKAVTEALRGFGARVKFDQPIAYGVEPTPAPNGYPVAPIPATNLARSVIRVQLDRPEQTGHVIAAAIGAGAASSSGLTFESSAADSVRRTRITEALGAAHLEAEAVAASLGGRLGALVNVTITGGPFAFPQQSLNFDNRFGQQASAPDVTVAATVTVQYRLVR
jgi:hypothetical protein